jgi:hypothetical protein
MEYFKSTITKDYKSNANIKDIKSEFFIYKDNIKNVYKIVIDREDDRRLVFKIQAEEMDKFKALLNNF